MWSYAVTSGGKRITKHIHWVVTVMFASSNGSVRTPQWRCCKLELNGLLVILKKWLRTHISMAPQLWKCFLRHCFNAFSNLFSAVMYSHIINMRTSGILLALTQNWHRMCIIANILKLCQWRYASVQRRREDWGGPRANTKSGAPLKWIVWEGGPQEILRFYMLWSVFGGLLRLFFVASFPGPAQLFVASSTAFPY